MADLSLQGRGATYKKIFTKRASCYLGLTVFDFASISPFIHCIMNLYIYFTQLEPVLKHGLRTNANLGSVVARLISANPGLNFNSGFLTALLKSLFWIIFFILLKASNHQIVDKTNYN